ncbi:polysaccharide deacetylase family protein [Sphingobacterium sp. UT-1RO-CII-1]|uniref:polysaccharide deacetylase family protein n=1 Tax=Sphingobacterium sp. UT-1RO-CII-1 TaxID=2995225 RepID=UPI00227C3875|nr:polysaccharide deacetylase family protein [Sphingobacterium sp. UT-1RO-CII-1]MCY4779412.1 polysaccharide deacetylase family protein [Sphingobacterium sp. UT-1RO-CII-1]
MNFFYVLLLVSVSVYSAHAQTLVECLGYDANAKLLIINNDDAGMCYSSNQGTILGMENGLLSSATIMFTCDWSPAMVKYALENPKKSFGVHLTLTSEWKGYKWGSVAPSSEVSSLLDENGKLWAGVRDVYKHAKPEEAYLEGKAQIQKALDYGLDITHIDSHMGTFQLHPKYLEKYIQLAVDFNLPLRMASQSTHERFKMGDLRNICEKKGLIFPDFLVYEELENYNSTDVESFWVNIINNLSVGVTELYLHASTESDELKAITNSWKKRAEELNAFTSSEAVRNALKQNNVHIISYRELRDLQRNTINNKN